MEGDILEGGSPSSSPAQDARQRGLLGDIPELCQAVLLVSLALASAQRTSGAGSQPAGKAQPAASRDLKTKQPRGGSLGDLAWVVVAPVEHA